MTPMLIALLVLLAIVLVPLAVVNRIFHRLADLQRQVDALARRVETMREGERHLDRPAAPEVPVAAEVQISNVREVPGADEVPLPEAAESYRIPRAESLESRIGSRWLLYIGVIAIVVGAAYFEKLAFENHWVSETARVIQGGLAGVALMYAGIRFGRAGYSTYGQMISGCGAAILYVSTYAAFNFYHLIDRPVAFALMLGVTAATAVLADRQCSQGLAVLAVGGGFATPFMLPSATDAQVALFGYDAVLIGGTVVLSRRRDWPLLDVISYGLTAATVAAWGGRFYTPEKYARTEIFLTLFCAMFMAIIYAQYRLRTPLDSTPAASSRLDRAIAGGVLWTAPPAYYLASLAILQSHSAAMLVWLVCLALLSGLLTPRAGASAPFGLWLASILPLLIWCTTYRTWQWLAPGLIAVASVYAIALAAQLYRELEREEFRAIDVLWLHLNALLTFAAVYLLVDRFRHADMGAVAAGFAGWHGALAGMMRVRDRDRALHFAGVAFTLLMIAIGLQFDGAAMTIGWAAEGAIVIALGLSESRGWLRNAGAGLFVVALWRTAYLLASPAAIGQTPLLNARAGCATLVIALCYALAWLHHRREDASQQRIYIAAALVAAQLVTVMLITSEIDAYWSARADALTRELAKSVAWAIYATLLIVIGLRGDYAPIRYFAILLFALTTLKVFLVDMAQLERVYRILSVIGLGIALLVTSYLYQYQRGRQTD